MILDPLFERFVTNTPLTVMARATLEHALSPKALDALFEKTAVRGYTRQLLFSTAVDLISLVACGQRPTVKAAYHHLLGRVPVSLKSVYEKLTHIETAVSAGLAAYNVLSVLKASLLAVHGRAKVEADVSGYYMAREWSAVYAGMMVALPAERWSRFGVMPPGELAACLREWSGKVNLKQFQKSAPRKPTKRVVPCQCCTVGFRGVSPGSECGFQGDFALVPH